jgi:hypothetical protein
VITAKEIQEREIAMQEQAYKERGKFEEVSQVSVDVDAQEVG